MQPDLATLGTDGVQLIVRDAAHSLHVEKPGVVAKAICLVVSAVRERRALRPVGQWQGCPSCAAESPSPQPPPR
jgi:hypothetical protein